MAIGNDLKQAIILMPQKEKDKLLLRLITKDANLVLRLEYELIEEGATLQSRRDEIKTRIERTSKASHYTPGWMMMDMRSLSGDISQHVKTTKDKYGEIELNLYMINAFFDNQLEHLRTHTSKSDSCAEYIAKKAQTILKGLEKLDEDFYVDFERDVSKMLANVHLYCPKNFARELKIVKLWP
jgi:hypothetical protein